MQTKAQHKSRGFMLLIVLTLIATLLLIAALIYQQSHDSLLTAAALKSRSIAAARAEQGAEAALVDVRNAFANVENLAPCTSLSACTGAQIYSVTRDLGAGGDPTLGTENATGGGLQYTYQVWRRTNPSGVTSTVVIDSTGYLGYSTDPVNSLLSSQVELEVTAPVSSVALTPPGGSSQKSYAGGGN